MTRYLPWIVGGLFAAVPFLYREPYPLHILILILIWSFTYTCWTIMGRFGLVSLGHGGFMGIGAYITALLWNHDVTPWLGIPLALLAAGEKIPEEKLTAGLDNFFRYHRFLDIARNRPIPHETFYYNSGYFYLFGHYYAARLIQKLPPGYHSHHGLYWICVDPPEVMISASQPA